MEMTSFGTVGPKAGTEADASSSVYAVNGSVSELNVDTFHSLMEESVIDIPDPDFPSPPPPPTPPHSPGDLLLLMDSPQSEGIESPEGKFETPTFVAPPDIQSIRSKSPQTPGGTAYDRPTFAREAQ